MKVSHVSLALAAGLLINCGSRPHYRDHRGVIASADNKDQNEIATEDTAENANSSKAKSKVGAAEGESESDAKSPAPPNSDPCGFAAAFGKAAPALPASIVGGIVAKTSDLVTRSTVKLTFAGGSYCSGTLIGYQQIVTASHCFSTLTLPVSIGLGVAGTPAPGLKATGAVVHPKFIGNPSDANGYLPQTLYDVTVLTFSGTLPPEYSPVVIGSTVTELKQGSPVILAGYGAISDTDRALGRPLSFVQTTLLKLSPEWRELQLAQGAKQGGCFGDSGGPSYLMDSSNTCLKVLSATTGPGRGNTPSCDAGSGTLMDVTLYQGWISCALKDLAMPLPYLKDDASKVDCSLNKVIR